MRRHAGAACCAPQRLRTPRLASPALQALAPRCAQLQNDSTLRVMLSLFMPELSLQSQAIKLQWNAGTWDRGVATAVHLNLLGHPGCHTCTCSGTPSS